MMRNRIWIMRLVFIVATMLIITGYSLSCADAAPVVVINVKGEIDESQVALVHKALSEAESRKAQLLIMEIDTFGGLVDSAVKIRDMISSSPLETICYIKNRAWSAGALIAIAHHHIAIAPGGSIGAAEPIPATEKTVAALKAEFAATAHKSGRDARVAEAMVDKSLGLPGYAEKGQILALTDYQATEVGYADIVAVDRAAVLNNYGLSDNEVLEYNREWPEKLAGWLSDPVVKSLLLSIIFLAVFTEIKTAGMGAAASIGVIAALLFFASQWLTGLAGWLELLLFIGGLLLLVFELHAPGTGLFFFAGTSCILLSFFLTLGGNTAALNIVVISLLVAIIIFILILKRLPTNRLWSKLVLKDAETTQEGFVSGMDYSRFLGKEGTTVTLLRPAGIINVDGVHLDVVTEGQYIKQGVKVRVVSVSGGKIVVRPASI